MGLTTSYVWRGYKPHAVSPLINHDARSVEQENGIYRKHSNTMIDPTRTHLNEVLVNDGQGGFKLAETTQEIKDAFNARLDQRKPVNGKQRKIRCDSMTMVSFILQLDPDFTGECKDMTPEKREEVDRLLNVMIDEVIERMGAKNVIQISKHWDETHPHVHIECVAMTMDDRVRYRDAVGLNGAPCKWELHHDVMRERLRENGYDATDERVGEGRKGVKLSIYKKAMDQQDAIVGEASRWAGKVVADAKLEAEALKESAQKVRDEADRYAEARNTEADKYLADSKESYDMAYESGKRKIEEDMRDSVEQSEAYAWDVENKADQQVERLLRQAREKIKREQDEMDEKAQAATQEGYRAGYDEGMATAQASNETIWKYEKQDRLAELDAAFEKACRENGLTPQKAKTMQQRMREILSAQQQPKNGGDTPHFRR